MFLGAVLAWSLVDARHILRADGSRVILMKHPTWQSEIYGLWEVLRSDNYILLLFPMFLSSNWFYTYHFADVNLARFNIRTRALNNTLYWTSQIIGAGIFGYALDSTFARRSVRAKTAAVTLFVITMGEPPALTSGTLPPLTICSHLGRRLRLPEKLHQR